ncbi:MAG: hypothetical protein ACRDHZ_01965 [Ktedonobacteraceae bacterium]
MSGSKVACFRERQALEEQAARLGLDGLAQVAQHEAINARATRGARRILHLLATGKQEEAYRLMNQDDWGEGALTEEMAHDPSMMEQ